MIPCADGRRLDSRWRFRVLAAALVGWTFACGGWSAALAEEPPVAAPAAAAAQVDAAGNVPDIAAPITVARLKPHVEWLASPALGGRRGETGKQAADYVAKVFAGAGLVPVDPQFGFLHPIEKPVPLPEQGSPPVDTAEPQIIGQNVVGLLRGADPQLAEEYIVIGAHYDHIGVINGQVYPGADDNASGVSMLIEVARVLAAEPKKLPRSLLFVAYDLEEVGLVGSRYFVAQPPIALEKIKLSIVADMIGRDVVDVDTPLVFSLGSEHAPELRKLIQQARTEDAVDVGYMGIDLIGNRSDYAPYRDRKIPFLFFSTSEHGDYHRPTDTPSRVDYEKLAAISRMICRIVDQAARAPRLPAWQDEPIADLEEVRTGIRLIQQVLADQTFLKPGSVERIIAQNALLTLKGIERRGEFTKAERTWLIGLAQMLFDR